MGGKANNKAGGLTQDPAFLQYLQGILGGNTARMGKTYANLGLDTSGEAMGQSPQEQKDLGWLAQGAQAAGTEGFLQNAPNQLNQLAQQANQTTSTQGAAGTAAGLSAGLGTGA
jgi:hypothetical protein